MSIIVTPAALTYGHQTVAPGVQFGSLTIIPAAATLGVRTGALTLEAGLPWRKALRSAVAWTKGVPTRPLVLFGPFGANVGVRTKAAVQLGGPNVYLDRMAYGSTAHWRSTDHGVTWSNVSPLSGMGTHWPDGPDTLLGVASGQLYRSNAFGAPGTWVAFGNPAPLAGGPAMIRLASGRIIVAVGADANGLRLVYTDNDGGSWTTVVADPTVTTGSISPHGLWEDPTQPGRVFFVWNWTVGPDNSDVYRSQDGGSTWQRTRVPVPDNSHFCNTMIVLRSGTLLVDLAHHGFGAFVAYVFRSVNSGNGWTNVFTTTDNQRLGDLNYRNTRSKFAQHRSGRVWLVGRWYSDDDGVTWVDTGYNVSSSVAGGMGQTGDAIYRSRNDSDGTIDRSTDGVTWTPVNVTGALHQLWGYPLA